jgi:hypothetical protein
MGDPKRIHNARPTPAVTAIGRLRVKTYFDQERTMKTATGASGKFRLTAALGLLALVAAGAANATCMMSALHQSSGAKPPEPATLVPSVYHPDSPGGSFLRANYVEYDEGIVGMWEFKWNAAPPFGPDYGTQQWHSDGTEITFSGGQNPETGDVCLGVWRQVGRNTYTLNHIAMGRPAPGAAYGLRIHLHFLVTLNPSGTEMSGTFTAKAFAETAADPFDETSTPIASGSGTVTAVRVVPD